MRPPSTGTPPDCERDSAIALMFARNAALSPPGVPAGLNERIVRNVPRLAQMPAPCAPLRVRALRVVVPVRAVAHPAVRRAAPGRRPVGGWAALAAGIAALALMLPTAFPAHRLAHTVHVSPLHQLARIQPDAGRPGMTPNVAAPVSTVKLAANHLARAHGVPGPLPVVPDSDAAFPMLTQPAPVQVAFAVPAPAAPSRPVYGPVDTEARQSSGIDAQNGARTGAATGFAFTNYDTGMQSGAHPH